MSEKKKYTVFENKTSSYSIIIPGNATHCMEDMATSLGQAITAYAAEAVVPIIKDNEDTEHDSNKEILLWKTNRPESQEVTSKLGYTEYDVVMKNGKLVIAGQSEAAVKDGIDRLLHFFNACKPTALVGDPAAVLEEGTEFRGKVKRFIDGIPTYKGGKLDSVNDAEDNSYAVCIKDTNEKEYKAYLKLLEKNGYEKYNDNNIAGNLFAIYQKAGTQIFTEYTPCYNKSTIVVAHKGLLPCLKEDNVYEDKKIKTFFAQLKPNNVANTNGLTYVWRLCDGSFIVIDGGMDEYDVTDGKTDSEKLYDFLKKHTVNEKKPRIAAWIFTHAHDDHINGFMHFAAKYAPMVKVEKFIFNLPPHTVLSKGQIDYQNKLIKCLTFFGDNVEIIHAHSGEEFYLRDAKIEMLYTLDDFYPKILMSPTVPGYPTPYNNPRSFPKEVSFFNDSGLVFTVEIKGQKFMILADASFHMANMLTDRYGDYLKSDFMQVAHHASHGGSLELYSHVKPDVVFFPTSLDRFIERVKLSHNSYLIDRLKVKEVYDAGEETMVFELPYKIKK